MQKLLRTIKRRLVIALAYGCVLSGHGGTVLETITAADPNAKALGQPIVKTDDGKTVFEIKGTPVFSTPKSHPVNLHKYYRIVITARTLGTKPSNCIFGFVPEDKTGRIIPSEAGDYPVAGSFSELTKAVKAGDTVIRLRDASGWKVSKSHAVAFDAREDSSDIPNFNLVRGVGSIITQGNCYVVTLGGPLTNDYPAGTKVREHASEGGSYCYVGNEAVKPEWSRLQSKLIKGDRIRRGVDKVRIVILPNRTGNHADKTTQIETITLEEYEAPALKDEQGLKSADQLFERRVAVSNDATTATTMLCSGPEGIQIFLRWQDDSSQKLVIRPFDTTITDTNKSQIILKDAGIELSPGKVRDYVRPNPVRYSESFRQTYIKQPEKWAKLPSPLAYRFPISLRLDAGGLGIWLDGRYAGRIDQPGRLKDITFEVSPGSALGETVFDSTPVDPKYLPLDIARLPAVSRLPESTVIKLTDYPEKVKFNQPAAAWLDVGQTYRELADSDSDGVNIRGRSSFDGLKDSILVTMPLEQYIRAWMLCVVDDDPKKDPVVTARLTRFVEGAFQGRARDAMADVTVKLPRGNEKPGPGIVQAGVMIANGKTNPVWLVEVPLEVGSIQDLLWDEKPVRGTLSIGTYLDFELLGKLTELSHPFRDQRWKPDKSSVSGVKVLALTLEKTPVEMEVRQTQPGNIFHNAEKPELSVALRPRQDGKYMLRWSIQDVDGQTVDSGKQKVKMKAGDSEREIIIPLQQAQLGWYGIDIELWQDDRRLVSHPASFALLGKDTRQAGFESPYSCWWFTDWHYAISDPEIAGPILMKAGFRRAMICPLKPHLTEDKLAKWKFTSAVVPWGEVHELLKKGASDAEIEKFIGDYLVKYPHVKHAMIFAESIKKNHDVAPELLGVNPDPKLEDPEADERWQYAERYAKILREKFPNLLIVIGNSSVSTELIAEGLRRGFPEEYADYIGNEALGRTCVPEKNQLGVSVQHWPLRELARIYGYNWGVGACVESIVRLSRLIGDDRQAEWLVRDGLVSHAYRAPQISLGGVYDPGNAYGNSIWGEGICRRYPLLYPKKVYVAVATLTKVLDRVTLLREAQTGSRSVYALEFSRPDGKIIYALWAGRGTGYLKIELPKGTGVEVVDMYGRARKLSVGREGLDLTAKTTVQYLITPVKAQKITCGKRAYPHPDDQPPGNLRVVNALDKADEWVLNLGKDPLLEHPDPPYAPFRTAGNFIMRSVKDDEKGDCLEVELVPNDKLPALMSEYAVLRLKKPITVAGEPTTVGIWVKGNSGWGQVYWEIEDAKGVRRISCGTTVHHGDVLDYDGRISVNFDGWNFLSLPITAKSPIPDLSTGSVPNLWEWSKNLVPDSPSQQSSPVYPIKVTGLAVSLPPQALYLTEMNRIKQVLRLRDLSVYE